MARNQRIFDEFFRGQTYGPRDGFVAREWQEDCLTEYQSSITEHPDSGAGNGGRAGQHRFLIYAGTASGKTKSSAMIAAFMLNTKRIDQIVILTPNRSTRNKTRRDFLHYFGIDLVVFHARRHANGIPRTQQGYILTYGHLLTDPTLHRRICAVANTLVIFDEVHHLGDDETPFPDDESASPDNGGGWGGAAVEAFWPCPYILSLSGTPYRSDNRRIPFVKYEDKPGEDGVIRFVAVFPHGYRYTLGRAVADGNCRKPSFYYHDATVLIRTGGDGQEMTVTFDDDVSRGISSLRLKGAVSYGSKDRRNMLEQALAKCSREGRKVIIFLGGDTEGARTPTQDASEHLPDELREMGIPDDEFDYVTGDDPDAQAKIETFGKSPTKWILIAINMVSEGTDIPELSAAVFLTSITAKQTTAQRIGRVLRYMGPADRHNSACIFMFRDPDLMQLAAEIEADVDHWHEVKLKRAASGEGDGPRADRHDRAEAIGIGDGKLSLVMFNGRTYPAAVYQAAEDRRRRRGLPVTMLNVLMELELENADDIGVTC